MMMVMMMTKILALFTLRLASSHGEEIFNTTSSCDDPDAIWCDEFSTPGPPNSAFWNYELGNGVNGWGNFEVQNYRKKNAVVEEDGMLHISVTTRSDATGYDSARLKTQDKVLFQYVTLEARIQIPDLSGGLFPAFWTLGSNVVDVGWPACGEIGIAGWGKGWASPATEESELQTSVSSTFLWRYLEENAIATNAFIIGSSGLFGFHDYKLDWTPYNISTYIDGQLILTLPTADVEAFHLPQHIILNMAVGGRSKGSNAPNSKGGEMLVDWIRAYDNGFGSNVKVEACDDCSVVVPSDGNGISPAVRLSIFIGIGVLALFAFLFFLKVLFSQGANEVPVRVKKSNEIIR